MELNGWTSPPDSAATAPAPAAREPAAATTASLEGTPEQGGPATRLAGWLTGTRYLAATAANQYVQLPVVRRASANVSARYEFAGDERYA
jgi:hypothetical protein